MDSDGYLYITGRTKNLIVLGSGKKVNPEEVEAVISESRLIKEVCVVGRLASEGLQCGCEEICAVAVPPESTKSQSGMKADLEEEIRNDIDRLAATLAPFKRPTKVYVRYEDLPRSSTRKVKRALVAQWLDSLEQAATTAQGL
jgi:long-chain acyl-CoA synthetase